MTPARAGGGARSALVRPSEGTTSAHDHGKVAQSRISCNKQLTAATTRPAWHVALSRCPCRSWRPDGCQRVVRSRRPGLYDFLCLNRSSRSCRVWVLRTCRRRSKGYSSASEGYSSSSRDHGSAQPSSSLSWRSGRSPSPAKTLTSPMAGDDATGEAVTPVHNGVHSLGIAGTVFGSSRIEPDQVAAPGRVVLLWA